VLEPPPVTITDLSERTAPGLVPPVARDEVRREPSAVGAVGWPAVVRRLRGPGGLLAAAAVGYAVAQLPAPADPAPDPPPSAVRPQLTLVVAGQPVFDAVPGLDPVTSAEVVVVNTGPAPVRLTGAAAGGMGLRWAAGAVLGPGEQAVVVLREGNACARLGRQPQGSADAQELRVEFVGSRDALRDEVVLRLPGALVDQYDDFVRSFCGLPYVAPGRDQVAEPS